MGSYSCRQAKHPCTQEWDSGAGAASYCSSRSAQVGAVVCARRCCCERAHCKLRLQAGRARGVLPERTCYHNGAVPALRDRARNCSVSRRGAGSILGWPAPLEDFQACRWDGLTGVARMARAALGPCWRWVANRERGRHRRSAAAFVAPLAARGLLGSRAAGGGGTRSRVNWADNSDRHSAP
jgi:hypothetical protein